MVAVEVCVQVVRLPLKQGECKLATVDFQLKLDMVKCFYVSCQICLPLDLMRPSLGSNMDPILKADTATGIRTDFLTGSGNGIGTGSMNETGTGKGMGFMTMTETETGTGSVTGTGFEEGACVDAG